LISAIGGGVSILPAVLTEPTRVYLHVDIYVGSRSNAQYRHFIFTPKAQVRIL
jgi:hypothetical protein